MLGRYQNFRVRENLTIWVGAIIATLILGYAFIWQPWQLKLDQLRQRVPVKQATLAWMQKQAKAIAPLVANDNKREQNIDTPLLTIIEQTAKVANIRQFIRRMTPAQDEGVKVWLTDADFDQWLMWLENIRTQGVEVGSATVNRSKDNRVTIRATLQKL